MEDLLKFVSSASSTRSKAFMFIWRILIAIILTNRYMNNNHYYFTYADISLKEVIRFIYSLEFVIVVSVYLIMIFIFFLLIRFAVIIFSLIFNKSPSEQYLNKIFIFYIHSIDSKAYFKDKESLETVQQLAEEVKHIKNPIFEFFEDRLNVLLANSFLIHSLSDIIKSHELYKWWLGLLFGLNDLLLIIGIIIFLVLIYLNTAYEAIIRWIVTVSNRGFL